MDIMTHRDLPHQTSMFKACHAGHYAGIMAELAPLSPEEKKEEDRKALQLSAVDPSHVCGARCPAVFG